MSKTWTEVADELEVMQQELNPPMGISCIRQIVSALRRGNIQDAKLIASLDGDKMWQYRGLRKYIHENLEPIGYWDEELRNMVK